MDKVLLLQNILEALVFVISTVIFALLYGLLDKKKGITDKIVGGLKKKPKLEVVIHIVVALALILIVRYFGLYVFKLWDLAVIFIMGAISGICIYNINRNNF